MNTQIDKITYTVKVATDVLLVKNPMGTSMGIFLGIILQGVTAVINPAFPLLQGIKLSNLTILHFIAVGVFAFNIKGFFNRHKVSPEVKEAILFIDEQLSKGLMTKIEAKQRYRELTTKVIENVTMNSEVSPKVNNLKGAMSENKS